MEKLSVHTPIESLKLDSRSIDLLKRNGINSVIDLVNYKKEDIFKMFCDESKNTYSYYGRNEFIILKRIMHFDFGITFKDEFEGTNLTLETANIKIDDLELPTVIKRGLRGTFGIAYLGELLTDVTFSDLKKTRNVGVNNLRYLKEYIHSLGYELKEEEIIVEEKIDELRKKGVQLLEDIFDDNKIYRTLYRHGIFTLDDLLEYGPDVFSISGFGPQRQKNLLEKMRKLGLKFDERTSGVGGSMMIGVAEAPSSVGVEVGDVLQLIEGNDELRSKVYRKEQLVLEFDRLYCEKQELETRLKAVDEQILDRIKAMKEGLPNGKSIH